MAMTQGDKYALRIFFFAAIPLAKTVAENDPKFVKKFKGKNFVFQISVLSPEFKKTGKLSTHFVVKDGKWETHTGETHPHPDIELEFSTPEKFILFFTGKGMPLPKIKGALAHLPTFVNILMTLLKPPTFPKNPKIRNFWSCFTSTFLPSASANLTGLNIPTSSTLRKAAPTVCTHLRLPVTKNSKAGSALRTVRPFRDAANANVANLSYACASTLPNTLLKFS